ncbi:MAG: hypothetical protein WC934_05750 [Acidithiobacillus sp.]|jgi:hypothetical protein|uniref:hypothetical protein n=1 Tax=Acidithiobacillus sp. TaxID=1872118 RepID=UPI00355EA013
MPDTTFTDLRNSELALSVIAVPELISAFCHLQREGRLTDAQYQIIKRALMTDIADALPANVAPPRPSVCKWYRCETQAASPPRLRHTASGGRPFPARPVGKSGPWRGPVPERSRLSHAQGPQAQGRL